MWVLAGVGAIVAGLLLLLREGLPLLEARRTGVIRTRSSRPQPVDRKTEPERFAQLVRQRSKALGAPAILMLAGTGWTVLQVAAIVLQVR